MSKFDQIISEREELITLINEIIQFDPVALGREQELGSKGGFSIAISSFKFIIETYNDLKASDLNLLTYATLSSIRSHAHSTRDIFNKIGAFETGPEMQSQLLDNISDKVTELFTDIIPFITYSKSKLQVQGNQQEIIEELTAM